MTLTRISRCSPGRCFWQKCTAGCPWASALKGEVISTRNGAGSLGSTSQVRNCRNSCTICLKPCQAAGSVRKFGSSLKSELPGGNGQDQGSTASSSSSTASERWNSSTATTRRLLRSRSLRMMPTVPVNGPSLMRTCMPRCNIRQG